jgi:hypothetical protein
MPSMPPATFRRLVRASATYDIVVTAAFATPWTAAWNWQQLSALNVSLGGASMAPLDTFALLLASLLGSLVLVWSTLRLATPDLRLGRHDGAARLLFSAWMAWALHATGAPLLWLFLVPEFAWGVAQWWPVSSTRR